MVLCQRNYNQLQLIFNEYQRITGHDIEKAIKNEFSGDSEAGLLAIIRSVRNQAGFFAKQLHDSVKGAGTNDRQLIRIVVTRCEVDMGDIKRQYSAKYGESLADAIKVRLSVWEQESFCVIVEYMFCYRVIRQVITRSVYWHLLEKVKMDVSVTISGVFVKFYYTAKIFFCSILYVFIIKE